MKNLLFISLVSLFSLPAIGQLSPEKENQIDSLKQIIAGASSDTTIINAWMEWDYIISKTGAEKLNKWMMCVL